MTDTGQDDGYGPLCPFTVDRPVMTQRWERLTFLHWRVAAAGVQAVLPPGLTVETFDGTAWVGLVPFFMRVATAGGHGGGYLTDFPETNVRTYVRDGAGRPGIWFFSLDAARLSAVAIARATYRLPYYWSSLTLDESGDEISYTCRRRLPGRPRQAGGVTSRARISVGAPYSAGELSELDHFLTARWRLYSVAGNRRLAARAEHAPWPLHRATVHLVDDDLIAAAGLARPDSPPLAHYSPGVDVRIGRPEPAS
jgi:uncharacterized protein YqjF (DUF2071 family)